MIFSTLILAAGAGTRMKSERAKVAHELLGKPLVRWVIDAASGAGSQEIITIVGHEKEQVIPLVNDTTIVVQQERLGTGHAVKIAQPVLGDKDTTNASLVVLCGDAPLIKPQTIKQLVASQQMSKAAVCVLTHLMDDPTNYGRIIRDAHGNVLSIVEEKDATEQQRKVKECNSGAYCFDLSTLLKSIEDLSCDNAQGEYYLTDVVGICAKKGLTVKAHIVDADETQGINSRLQLAEATKSMQRRINKAHMLAGVTMLDPEQVWIEADVSIENDVELLPLTMLSGKTTIKRGSVIGPNSRVVDSTVGKNCHIDESVIVGATLEDEVCCGPRAYLRPGTLMKKGSKAGTHVEIKKSIVGEGSKIPHLSYFGDAELGEGVNIGAGSITCNYDGIEKKATRIGNNSFIGSDTMLVAPVTLGNDVATGAGSVITKDVPDGALAVERGEQRVIDGWSYRLKGGK